MLPQCELTPGMVFAYEPRHEPLHPPRVLAVKYVGKSEDDGIRFVFDVVGLVDSDGPWGRGTLLLDDKAVGDILGNS